jgi:carboxypeptidase Q
MLLRPLLPFLLLPCLVRAQETVVETPPATDPIPAELAERIRAEGIDHSQVMAILRDLTGKVGQRLTGSDNFTKACDWAEAEFRRFGVDEVHQEKWAEWPLTWNRGAWIGRITNPVQLDMYVATEAWTAGTAGLQKGQVVLNPTSAEEVTASLAGHWLIGRRPPRSSIRKACEAVGVLGFVYRAGDPDDKYPTRVRVFGDYHTALRKPDRLPKLPEIAVRADHFDELFELVAGGKPTECEFDIENRFVDQPVVLHNVIAEIRGSEKPDEVVIVSAHLDSWHQAQGCTDNGTGTATTIEAARILAKVGARPKRTIRFCLWGGEEQGLLGSIAYVKQHRTEMPKVSAVFNHDTGTNWAQSLQVTAAMQQQLEPVFAHVRQLLQPPDADWTGDVFTLRVVRRVAGSGGSDHASFLAAGVPGLDWGLKGRSDYFYHTWHTQWDTFDVAIPEYQRHTATVVALAALGTANLDQLLDRENVSGASGPGQSQMLAEGWFGAEFDELTFKSVAADGRAAKMGVQVGDTLTMVDGQEVTGLRQLFQFARDAEGDTVKFTFRRGDKDIEATAKKDELPQRPAVKRPTVTPGDVVPQQPGNGGVIR